MARPCFKRDLRTYFPIKRGVFSHTVGYVKAVDGVSFDIAPGKTLGLVGESGCGKTTVGRSILRLIPKTSGDVLYKGEDFYAYQGRELRRLRRQMQIVSRPGQQPQSTRDGRQYHRRADRKCTASPSAPRSRDMVADVRRVLDPTYSSRYPHEFSGGQRQRIGIARALSLMRPTSSYAMSRIGTGRFDSITDPESADDLQARLRRNIALPVHRHNLGGGRAFSGRSGGHVSGPDRGESTGQGALFQSQTSVHDLAVVRGSRAQPKYAEETPERAQGEVPSPSNPLRAALFIRAAR